MHFFRLPLRLLAIFAIAVAAPGMQHDAFGGGSGAPSEVLMQLRKASKDIGDDADPAIVDELPITTRTFEMGTAGFVPRHYPEPSDEDWMALLQSDAAAYGGVFGVHVDPADDPNSEGIPAQVELAFEHMEGVNPYVAFVVSHEDGPFTVARGEQLKRAAVATAEEYHPDYISLGVESNALFLFEPDSFPLYVDYARQIYDEVKTVSPDTMVMNNFQLDRMRGETALTGQDFEPHWDLIERFAGKLDLVSFTVYPFLNYETVEDIPAGYLAEIREHTELPVIVTETGWPTEDAANGASGSDELQIAYMKKLVAQANAIGTEAIVWVFPHDAPLGIAGGIFDHISLMNNDGSPKPAYEYWKAVNALPLDRGTADDLARALSGLWFDPALDGEGYNVVVGDPGTVIYFYGSDADGQRLWLISDVLTQPLVLGEERELDMFVATAGTFDMPVPSDQSLAPWGVLTVEFEGCDRARFELSGDGGESKVSDAVRLLGIAGAQCPAAKRVPGDGG